MTNPVILLGTQSNGETLPVQVDATGRLVAEGLQGPPGDQGPEGPPGLPQLPAGSFEGAVLGWVNGELAWLQKEGLPLPLGEEGQIVQIVDEEPIWVTNANVLPPPPPAVTVVQGTNSPDGLYGMFSSESVLQGPEVEWDKYARKQSFWETTEGGGQIGVSKGQTYEFTQKFNVEGDFGKLLILRGTAQFWHSNNGDSQWSLQCTRDNSYLGNVITQLSMRPVGNAMFEWDYEFQFLINRESVGDVNFTIKFVGNGSNMNDQTYINIQQWKTVDAGYKALTNQLELKKQVAELREALSLNSKSL